MSREPSEKTVVRMAVKVPEGHHGCSWIMDNLCILGALLRPSTTNQLGAEMSDLGWSGEKEQWRSKGTPFTLLSSVFQSYTLFLFCLIGQTPPSLQLHIYVLCSV